jgi:predicted transcriptional regulator
MQNSETAITLLMETIHEGDVSPRMFEVLSDLQRTLLDIIKSQTMYMVAIEENAKKISRDVDVYHNNESSTAQKHSGIKSRGTKDLMRALQDTIKEEDIQDVDGNENEE